jgi:protein kinase C substrate 80K-H
VDEEVSSDGKGLGKGERIALKYENGQHCWNGPLRSTTAVLACSEKDEIWKIVEEEKCVYRMDIGTPAVCGAETGGAPAAAAAVRDEL